MGLKGKLVGGWSVRGCLFAIILVLSVFGVVAAFLIRDLNNANRHAAIETAFCYLLAGKLKSGEPPHGFFEVPLEAEDWLHMERAQAEYFAEEVNEKVKPGRYHYAVYTAEGGRRFVVFTPDGELVSNGNVDDWGVSE